jgi:hypothetical protein
MIPVRRKRAGIPCVWANALALMKVLCQDDDRRMAGTTNVLSCARTSKQACYEAYVRPRQGERACRPADK